MFLRIKLCFKKLNKENYIKKYNFLQGLEKVKISADIFFHRRIFSKHSHQKIMLGSIINSFINTRQDLSLAFVYLTFI